MLWSPPPNSNTSDPGLADPEGGDLVGAGGPVGLVDDPQQQSKLSDQRQHVQIACIPGDSPNFKGKKIRTAVSLLPSKSCANSPRMQH